MNRSIDWKASFLQVSTVISVSVSLFNGIATFKNYLMPKLFFKKNSGYHIYPTPPLGQDMTQGQFLSGV